LIAVENIPESRFRKKPETSRRRFYQPREDDNRTDLLLYGRSRYRVDVGRKKTWSVGIKALVYFEVVSTLALPLGI
jgi:hypothetical protein